MVENPTTIEEEFSQSLMVIQLHEGKSGEAESGKILNIDESYRFSVVIDHDEVIDPACPEDFHDLCGQIVFVDRDG